MDDRRLFSRLIFTTDAKLNSHDSSWATKLLDISLNGALVERPAQWDPNIQSAKLEIIIQDSEIKLQMLVEIVHQENQLLGLSCKHIDVESISHLRRLLELNLGDASLLDRELERLFEHDNKTSI
ncbi:type IV pilus assembly PilZ [Shewanella halifaxensis HAW-EB4]|uniref:Cyclic diguanosine monophosphate-binding protein n=1 Tax=Shewanella halifaxensis (strain HAW-EB4) TaxID=458817 RepID=B0TQ74_SHEHH|nr:PilZ domain-containing protein [Shewanella halifaxensis]ABZ77666.1 type IV pilus assembly PilZ [Shewanella halifaxensis HAW-EB4]